MTTTHRFQIDMTTEELESIERLGQLAGLRTKRDVVINALTLFKWAAKEVLYGRSICSIDEETKATKQLELPALATIAETSTKHPLLTPEQRERRLAESARPSSEFTSERKSGPKGATYVEGGLVEDGGGAVA